ncbi:hypothetical protein F6Y05_34065 [Bacillus megaterium]|nr:hypothetical protein [Priestia megaterium]
MDRSLDNLKLDMHNSLDSLRLDLHNGERSFNFNTDLLIAKRTEKENELEILAVSLYETKSEINKLVKKNNGASGKIHGHPFYNYDQTKFTIKKFSNFKKRETAGKKHSHRITLIRKKDLVIDQTVESYPIVMLPKEEAEHLQTIVFEYVRDNIVSPLFPDVRIPQVLAGELFISIEEAQVILKNVNDGVVKTENEIMTAEMLLMYYQWVDYLVQELAKRNRLQHLEVIACPRDLIAYEIIINETEIREIVSRGLIAGWIKISKTSKLTKRYDGFDTYMPDYASTFKQRIESISVAQHHYGVIREQTTKYLKRLGRDPISVQLDAIEAGLKSLKKQKRVNIVGEPGVGKTYIMSSTAFFGLVVFPKNDEALSNVSRSFSGVCLAKRDRRNIKRSDLPSYKFCNRYYEIRTARITTR